MQVGFIGIGAMGAAMATRLIEAGHTVQLWNRSPDALKPLVAKGGVAVATAAEAFAGDAVITMLANDEAVRSIVVDGGLLDRAPKGIVHVEMATLSLDLGKQLAAEHAKRGIGYVAAPVLGRPDAAAAGKLNIMAAGETAAIETVQPLFDAMGQKTWIVGAEPHIANATKLACNFVLACAIETLSEAFVLGERNGVEPQALYDILTGTLFAAPAFKTYGQLIIDRKFEPALFKTRLGLKDVRLALAAGEAAGVPLPFGSVVRDNLIDAIGHGDAEKDWAILGMVARRRAGMA
jgi:3-hydroxyisobutyrate dehydrogenase-like beta-hydroxyacid dehydrogenase